MQGLPSQRSASPALGRAPTPALQRQATVRMASEPPTPAHAAPALERMATPALKSHNTVKMPSDAPPAASVTALPADMSGRLRELGLSSSQVDAVLALSREVVERVVGEVVPILAETLIKEEIARLTREA